MSGHTETGTGAPYVDLPEAAPGSGTHPWRMDRPSEPGRHGRPPAPRNLTVGAGSAGRALDEAAADEAAADEARRRLHEQGIVPIEPDDRIGVMLAPGERVVAVHRAVSLERRKGWLDPLGGLGGDLYVTTRRLIHFGPVPVEYALCEIREAVVATGALRLIVGEGRGVEIEVHDPRLLRVEIAAVREAARAPATDLVPEPTEPDGGRPPAQGAGR